MCRGPAVSLNFRPHTGHLTIEDSSAYFIMAACRGSTSLPLFCCRTARKASDCAFHLGIFSFCFICSIFFSTISPCFIIFTCWLSTSLCFCASNYFLFFWNTFLQLASCLVMLSGLNFLPQPIRHTFRVEGSYSTMSTWFYRFTSLMLLSYLSFLPP